ncbi:MAG: ATP-grasp domain-containing protein [Planctomycetes bacterium]|nr:ATP-grasp domain-containing protein [Planctomycetota bacterium]
MLRALVADFAAAAGAEVCTLRSAALGAAELLWPTQRGRESISVNDSSYGKADWPKSTPDPLSAARVHAAQTLEDEQRQFDRLASAADWTVVIAPETAGVLLNRCRRVVSLGGRLLGPSPEFVALTSDKHLTAEHLRRADVPSPQGIALSAGDRLPEAFPYPAVLKPCDGAGSQDVRFIADRLSAHTAPTISVPSRLEHFCPGRAVSVAAMCGPEGCFTLPPCRQHLSGDGRFEYLGGSLPLAQGVITDGAESLSQRAERLARTALAALPPPFGYVGLDLVLGPASDGTQDFVIEVNPRLTTSYVGLRAAAQSNLAEAMLGIAEGRGAHLAFRRSAVEFTADGTVHTR